MRPMLIAAIMLIASTANADGPSQSGRTRDDVDKRTLTADQIGHYASSYYPMIRTCYFAHGRAARRATGELAVKLVIHRGGHIHDFAIDAPGVTGKLLRKLETCI